MSQQRAKAFSGKQKKAQQQERRAQQQQQRQGEREPPSAEEDEESEETFAPLVTTSAVTNTEMLLRSLVLKDTDAEIEARRQISYLPMEGRKFEAGIRPDRWTGPQRVFVEAVKACTAIVPGP